MPATAHVKMLPAFGGMVHDYGVFRVAAVLYEGVPPAALLPHVIEDEVGRSVVCVARNGENIGPDTPFFQRNFHSVGALFFEGGEVEPEG